MKRILLTALLTLIAAAATAAAQPKDEGYKFMQDIPYTSADEQDA